MSTATLQATESLSPWWGRAVALVMVVGFSTLILISVKAYENAPPIPAKSVASSGEVVFTAEEVASGQAVFLKYGLMDNGTIWGHGGMLGPDFSAQTLHGLALHRAERIAQSRFQTAYTSLGDVERSAVDGAVASQFKTNGYDPATDILQLRAGSMEAFDAQVEYWTTYFKAPAVNGGLARNTITDGTELRQLT